MLSIIVFFAFPTSGLCKEAETIPAGPKSIEMILNRLEPLSPSFQIPHILNNKQFQDETNISIPITFKDFQLKEGIKFFSLGAKRKEKFISIKWELSKNKEIRSIELYRGDETSPLRHFMKITPDEGIYIDKKLVVNTSYKYALRVKYEDGTLSKISQIKEIKY